MTKIARPGSEGNMRLLKEYGGGSTPPRQHFATGGAVRSGGNPALDEGLSASGEAARPNLSRPGRKAKKDKDKAKTNINIVVMGKDKDAAPPIPGPMAAAGPMPPPAMPMPMKPPMGAPMAGPDGPPMPMRKAGGRVENHDDAAMDKKMIKAAVHKHEEHDHPGKPMTKLSMGGPAKPPVGIDDGAGGGKGRLEKIKVYGK